ncbi:MAG: insulinase family protein [Candidatus Marinimicrobia bacterium]|nr:insulinase family protein [Candidatus Neomarinimicrobiota bacterium]MBT3576303.1 insulinase family protein [Candidatus Neomarinimicrobiota bacterium]MBT3680498.1 insulinase family protein [Candidatus Neomarinimicrobiota bacterium]MBT3951712.1 insulinase family protein [Candidatus Neomarinimicrobiota bacterium]MBT4252283.1 insulinase family protein [Candidatus Neomarinimicrobiota bacterium]
MTSLRKQTTLSNGLTIVTETVDTVRSVALGIWVRAGSRYEPEPLAGISHFLEHTVFKGTKNRSTFEIASSLESVGGHLNAFTTKEYTCYHARFLSEYLEEAVDVLSDLLLHPTFPTAEIEREKSVVLDELRDSKDVPEELAFDTFERFLYPDNSIGKPILGNETSIKGFTPEALTAYLDQNYSPENTIIVAAGFVDHEALVKLIEERYDRPGSGANQFESIDTTSYIPGKEIRTKDIQQSHLITGLPIFSVFDERRYDIAVLNSILSGGMSSRLFQNIREAHGVAYQIFSFINLYRDTGSFGVYLATDPAKRDLAVELTLTELEKMVKDPVSDAELEMVKAQYKSGIVMGDESMERRMMRLGRQQIYYGENIGLDKFLKKIEAIDVERIQVLARELFNPDRFFTSILEPASAV